jgi:hypothetical protein
MDQRNKKKLNVFTDCNGMIRRLNTGEYRLYHRRKAGTKASCSKVSEPYSSLLLQKKMQTGNLICSYHTINPGNARSQYRPCFFFVN